MFRSESSISSEWQFTGVRQGSPVPRELLPAHIGRNCQSSATSIFQPPPSRRTTTSSQHARPFGVLRRRSDGLKCTAWRPPRPVAQCRQFPEDTKDASVSECTWTLTYSALEALRNALYKFKTYLLTYLLTYLMLGTVSLTMLYYLKLLTLLNRDSINFGNIKIWTSRSHSLYRS